MRVAALPGKSPQVSFRIVFAAGSAADPIDKPGLASLTARLVAGSKLIDHVGTETTLFRAETDLPKLHDCYDSLRSAIIAPSWNDEALQRAKQDAIKALDDLRTNDRNLASELLSRTIFDGTLYSHPTAGTASSLEKITLEDVKDFYHGQYTQQNLILGVAGGYPSDFLAQMKRDFQQLPEVSGFRPRNTPLKVLERSRAVIVRRPGPQAFLTIGFPMIATPHRSDYAPVLLAASYLNAEVIPGEAENFSLFELPIGPVEPDNAAAALKKALASLDELIRNPLPKDRFNAARNSLIQSLAQEEHTEDAKLADEIASVRYGVPNLHDHLKQDIAKLTPEDLHHIAQRHLRTSPLVIICLTPDADALKTQLSPTVQDITVIQVQQLFQ